MPPTAKRLVSSHPGVARKASPGAIAIMRPAGDSTVIGTESGGNSKAHTSPSPARSGRSRTSGSGGRRRSAEVRLTSAGRLSPSVAAAAATTALAAININGSSTGDQFFAITLWNFQNLRDFEKLLAGDVF